MALQIEGTKEVKKVAFAVSATRASVEKTIEWGADALIVHHGLFWKFHVAKTITKAFAKRVIPLIKNDVNLLVTTYLLMLILNMEMPQVLPSKLAW